LTGTTGPLNIVADNTLDINSSGVGFDITGSGSSIDFSQESGSSIIGTTGVDAKKYGAGSNTVTVAGNVTGDGDYGIFAYNDAAAADVTIEQAAGTITGTSHGIRVDNYGTGAATIITAGTVTQTGTSYDSYGVYAYNAPTATDITLTQTSGTVSGHYYGMYGNNQGIGSTIISSAGNVTATDIAGVAAYNGAATKDIRISQTAGTITGGDYGIYAANQGTGTTSITVGGTVNGGTGAGIESVTSNETTIAITSTGIVGASSGIAIRNGGSGNAVVTSAGTVTGDTMLGLGDDAFNLTGGSYTGRIFGDDSVADDGNDTFAWTAGRLIGGFYGQGGSDTATVSAVAYDGSQVLDGGDDTSGADGIVDTLNLDGIHATSSGGNIVNWEIVGLNGSTLAINDGAWKVGEADEAGTGVFLSNGSTLDGMAGLALDGRLAIDATSSFVARGGGAGVYSVSGDVNNAGLVTLRDGAAGDIMTIAGNYVATNGNLQIDTALGDDESKTDKLIIHGDTSGTTRLAVNNVGGTGAPTVEGIRVIGVDGASKGSFSLAGDYSVNGKPAIVAGAYAYQLYQGGATTPNDGDWYLRSQLTPQGNDDSDGSPPMKPLYQAGVPSYEAYPQALLALNSVPTLQQRVGNRFWAGAGNQFGQGADSITKSYTSSSRPGAAIEGNGIWSRIEGAYNHIDPHSSTSDTTYDQDIFRLQIGVDRQLTKAQHGKLIGGLAVHYVRGKTYTYSPHGDGEIDTDGYGFGGTLTWYNKNGFYLDGQARVTWYESDLNSRLAHRGLTKGNDGFGYASSIEGGKRIVLNSVWSFTPQVQLVYSNVDFDTFNDAFGARVSNDRGESLRSRFGVTLDHEGAWLNVDGMPIRAHMYGVANIHYEFLGKAKVDVAGQSFASRNDRLWASFGAGASFNWNDDKYSFYGEALVNTSLSQFADSYSVVGRVGFRMRW